MGTIVILALSATPACADAVKVPVEWQHRQATFSYVGITTLYVCDSLESQVARILKYLGARADLKVRASCANPVVPTHDALVTAEFYVPVLADQTSAPSASASTAASASASASGQWTPVTLEAGHPDFIDGGDCELLQAMKELVTSNFSWRNLDYGTSCFPHEMTLHDFGVKGEALKVAAPVRGKAAP